MITLQNKAKSESVQALLNSGAGTYLGDPNQPHYCYRCCSVKFSAVTTNSGYLCYQCASTHPNPVIQTFARNFLRIQQDGQKNYTVKPREAAQKRGKLAKNPREKSLSVFICQLSLLHQTYLTVQEISQIIEESEFSSTGSDTVHNPVYVSHTLKTLADKHQIYRFKLKERGHRFFYTTNHDLFLEKSGFFSFS